MCIAQQGGLARVRLGVLRHRRRGRGGVLTRAVTRVPASVTDVLRNSGH